MAIDEGRQGREGKEWKQSRMNQWWIGWMYSRSQEKICGWAEEMNEMNFKNAVNFRLMNEWRRMPDVNWFDFAAVWLIADSFH